MAREATDPVTPYGATRLGVTSLVPEARLIPGAGPIPEGTYGVTEAQVDAWVDELSDTVAMTLDGWERLSNDPVIEADGVTVRVIGDLDRFILAARTIVHNGAASYLEAARFPERSNVNDTSYAAVLWQRYTDGLDRLAVWLDKRLADPEGGDLEEPPSYAGGPLWDFPEPLIGDGLRF